LSGFGNYTRQFGKLWKFFNLAFTFGHKLFDSTPFRCIFRPPIPALVDFFSSGIHLRFT